MTQGGDGSGSGPGATRWFAAALTAVFFLLEIINILHHAMWRDEMQVWSFAVHSHSLRELLYLTRYEGHPAVWQFLVYSISRFFTNPLAMQFLHLAIATMTAYVVARYSPFRRLEKVLIIFGYFLFFEYATISRDYALGILCLFSFCAVFRPGPQKRYGLLILLLALMAGSNIYSLIIALPLALMVLLEALSPREFRPYPFSQKIKCAGAAILLLSVILISLVHMRPPADAGWNLKSYFNVRAHSGFSGTLAMIWRAFVPIPRLSPQFWNTNLLGDHIRLMALLSILLLCISISFFIQKKTVLFLYLFALGALLLFKQFVYAGYLRHDGHVFILFLACLWLGRSYPLQRFPLRVVETMAGWLRPYHNRIFLSLLAGQVIAAMIASVIALHVPFSEAKTASNFLRSKHMDNMFIIGDPDAEVSSIAGYLNREIYYAQGERMGSYVLWDEKRTRPPEPILELGRRKAVELNEDVLVILNVRDQSAHEIASFHGSIVGSEDYYMYLVEAEVPTAISSSSRYPD